MQTSETTSHLIGGAKVPSTGEEGIEILNPATGDQVGYIPAGTAEDAKAAVAAAREALPGWSRLPAAERAGLIKAAARKLSPRYVTRSPRSMAHPSSTCRRTPRTTAPS